VTDSKRDSSGTSSEGNAELKEDSKQLNHFQVVSSVLAAGLGVQSSKNRERDFKQGKIGVFITAGIIFTLFFIGIVFTIVQVVLKSSGN
jgi:hypothetical protein